MNLENVAKSSQEQGVAAWIEVLNRLRIAEMMERLQSQGNNFTNAIGELERARLDIFGLIENNRGGVKGVHGFIAERTQVAIENARDLLNGFSASAAWINDNGPTDFVVDGMNVQQKFVQANCGLDKILEHLQKYPEYIQEGNVYQIPKDFYERLSSVWNLSAEQAGKLSGKDYSLWKTADSFFKTTGLSRDKIQPSDLTYKQVQAGEINGTLRDLENQTMEENQKIKNGIEEAGAPSWKEGAQVTAVSAALEAGTNFLLGIAKKKKAGKRLVDFTVQDWEDVGLDTAKGGATGAVRGSVVYAMTNLAGTPAPVASSLVTAAFGVLSQAVLLEQGKISETEFIENSELVCISASVSAVSSLLGQILIPIPVLGALVGNAAGMILYEIGKDCFDKREQDLIERYRSEIQQINIKLDAQLQKLIHYLQEEFARFSSLLDWAFDPDVNTAFWGSVQLADYMGVEPDKVLRTKADIDRYFLK